MKRFIKKLTILFLPLLFLYSVLILNDCNNYWGLQSNFSEYKGLIVYRFRDYMMHPKKNIILGDSRVAHFDESISPKLAIDADYSNLGFGGASLSECIQMFWWAANRQKLESVIFSISFYTMNKNYSNNRFHERLELAETPTDYLVNLEYMKLSLDSFLLKFESNLNVSKEDIRTSDESHTKYSDVISSVVGDNYEIDLQALDELKKIAVYCKENNISLTFIIPPVHNIIWSHVIVRKNISAKISTYKKYLAELAPVLDHETPDNTITVNYSNDFADGFHLKPESEGYLQFKKSVMDFSVKNLARSDLD